MNSMLGSLGSWTALSYLKGIWFEQNMNWDVLCLFILWVVFIILFVSFVFNFEKIGLLYKWFYSLVF